MAGDLAKREMRGHSAGRISCAGWLPAPDAPSVSRGTKSGQLDAGIPPLYGGQAYLWRVALASSPEVYVQTAQTTAANTSFYGLTQGGDL